MFLKCITHGPSVGTPKDLHKKLLPKPPMAIAAMQLRQMYGEKTQQGQEKSKIACLKVSRVKVEPALDLAVSPEGGNY